MHGMCACMCIVCVCLGATWPERKLLKSCNQSESAAISSTPIAAIWDCGGFGSRGGGTMATSKRPAGKASRRAGRSIGM